MEGFTVAVKHNDTIRKIAEGCDKWEAINVVADTIFNALLDGISTELVATHTRKDKVSRFVHITLTIDASAVNDSPTA